MRTLKARNLKPQDKRIQPCLRDSYIQITLSILYGIPLIIYPILILTNQINKLQLDYMYYICLTLYGIYVAILLLHNQNQERLETQLIVEDLIDDVYLNNEC